MSADLTNPNADSGRHPDEKVPAMLAAGLGLQMAGLVVPGAVLIPTVVFRTAGQAEALLLWAVSVSVMICGAITILQAVRVGRIGAGHILVAGTSGATIAVSVAALTAMVARHCSQSWCLSCLSFSLRSRHDSRCFDEF
ncbi:MAG: hypothetical protein OXF74_01290 [Rhodobacteraceae bacterium]|nr:hypothetical protein [Paracoccaceae bacterium]